MFCFRNNKNTRLKIQAYKLIRKNIDLFQCCEACDAITPVIYRVCPICRNYKFNNDKHYMKRVLREFLKEEDSDTIFDDIPI